MTPPRSMLTLLMLTAGIVPAAHAAAAKDPFSGATRLGPASDRQISVALALPLRDAEAAAAFVRHVTRIGDPLYRKFLTPKEFAGRFGADPEVYAKLSRWAVSKGLTPGEESTSHTILTLSGHTAQIEAAFGVRLSDYRAPDGRVFYAPDSEPSLAASGAPYASFSVIGLSSYNYLAPLARIKAAGVPRRALGSGPGGAFSAADLRSLYNVLPQVTPGNTETVAVYEQGGFTTSDVSRYLHVNHLPAIPIRPRLVNGFGGGVGDPGVELEAVLDIDMIAALNPAAKSILVYEDGTDPFAVSLLAALTAMANDDAADVISISYGLDEVQQGAQQIAAEAPLFTQLAAQGQEVFVSAGDQGAYGRTGNGLNVSDPASQPYVTSVGGTTLFSGQKAAYAGEEVWNDLGLGYGATGGGVSTYWAIPAYQLASGVSVAQANGGSSTFRNVPDVAAAANPATGVAVYSGLNGGWLTLGGTSASAPIWAGYYSLVNAASKGLGLGKIGFLNPALYAFAPPNEGFDMHDVLDGSNGNAALFGIPGFNAGQKYDNTTGWGSPNGNAFLFDFTVGTLLNGPNPPPAPNGFNGTTTSTTANLHWKASKGATGYFVVARNETVSQLGLTVTSDTRASVTGLMPGSLYAFVVYAVDPTGASSTLIFLSTRK